MPRPSVLTPAQRELIRNARGVSVRALAAAIGATPSSVQRALSAVRRAEELAPAPEPRPGARFSSVIPRRNPKGGTSWTLERIREARDAQIAGDFALPAELARAMQTDDAIYVPRQNRIDAVNAIAADLVPHESTRGEALAKRAARLVSAPRSVITLAHRSLVDHGIGVMFNRRAVVDGGTGVAYALEFWPLDAVKWNEADGTLDALTDDGQRIPILHGDGNWIVVRKTARYPWTDDAALLPGALIWAAHAEGIRSWAGSADAHGLAKVLGTLPEGVSLQSADESGVVDLSPEARWFMDMLIDLVSGNAGAGIAPAGASAQFLANPSNAHQIFLDLVTNREKAAARVYLGTDAILGSQGGAPGVDISALFGVASTKLQGDFEAIEQALRTGLYEPWAAENAGDSTYAPRVVYRTPDPDADRKSAEEASKRERLFDAVERMRSLGFVVTQDEVDALARSFGLGCAPKLAPAPPAAP